MDVWAAACGSEESSGGKDRVWADIKDWDQVICLEHFRNVL